MPFDPTYPGLSRTYAPFGRLRTYTPFALAREDTGWRTIHGAKVHIGKDGDIDKGPAHLVGKEPGVVKEDHAEKADKAPHEMTRAEFDKMDTAYHVTAASDAIKKEGFKVNQKGGVGGDSSKVYVSEDKRYSDKLAAHMNEVKRVLASDDPIAAALKYTRLPPDAIAPGGPMLGLVNLNAKRQGRELTDKEKAAVIAFNGPSMQFPETPPKFGEDLDKFVSSPEYKVMEVRTRNPIRKSDIIMGGESVHNPEDVFHSDYDAHVRRKAS